MILPEQAARSGGPSAYARDGPDYVQIVEIIGTQKFEEFVRNLEVEGVGVGITKDPPPLGVHVYPLKIKADFNIEIPILTPVNTREFKGLNDTVVKALPANPKGLTMRPREG